MHVIQCFVLYLHGRGVGEDFIHLGRGARVRSTSFPGSLISPPKESAMKDPRNEVGVRCGRGACHFMFHTTFSG